MASFIENVLIKIGVDTAAAKQNMADLGKSAQAADKSFDKLSTGWASKVRFVASRVLAPIAGSFALGGMISKYQADVGQVAAMTGRYSTKLEEWRYKRAALARVSAQDIEIYKKSRMAVVSFNIAMQDLSHKLMRSAGPAILWCVEKLNLLTKWVKANEDNLVRIFKVVAGVITAVFIPSLVKMGAALMMNPLTWIIAALIALVAVIDDLIVYMHGGTSAFSKFWAIFGTGPEIAAALTKAFNFLKDTIGFLLPGIGMVAGAFAAFKTSQMIIMGVVTAVRMLNSAFLANPIALALTAIVFLLSYLYDAWKRAGGTISGFFRTIREDVRGFLNQFGGLGDIVLEMADAILGFSLAVINAFAAGGRAVIGFGINAYNAVAGFIKSAIALFGSLAAAITGAVTAGWDAIRDFCAWLSDVFIATISAIGDAIASAFDFGALIDKAKAGLSSMADSVAGAFSGIFGGENENVAGTGTTVGEVRENAQALRSGAQSVQIPGVSGGGTVNNNAVNQANSRSTYNNAAEINVYTNSDNPQAIGTAVKNAQLEAFDQSTMPQASLSDSGVNY